MRDATRALTLLSIALLMTASVTGTATAAPQTISDNGHAYQGYKLQTESITEVGELTDWELINRVRDTFEKQPA